jgi:hypothetical protein
MSFTFSYETAIAEKIDRITFFFLFLRLTGNLFLFFETQIWPPNKAEQSKYI